jgi:hypothetical protein
LGGFSKWIRSHRGIGIDLQINPQAQRDSSTLLGLSNKNAAGLSTSSAFLIGMMIRLPEQDGTWSCGCAWSNRRRRSPSETLPKWRAPEQQQPELRSSAVPASASAFPRGW